MAKDNNVTTVPFGLTEQIYTQYSHGESPHDIARDFKIDVWVLRTILRRAQAAEEKRLQQLMRDLCTPGDGA